MNRSVNDKNEVLFILKPILALATLAIICVIIWLVSLKKKKSVHFRLDHQMKNVPQEDEDIFFIEKLTINKVKIHFIDLENINTNSLETNNYESDNNSREQTKICNQLIQSPTDQINKDTPKSEVIDKDIYDQNESKLPILNISEPEELKASTIKPLFNPEEQVSHVQSQTHFSTQTRSIMTENNLTEFNPEKEESEQEHQTWKIIIRQVKN